MKHYLLILNLLLRFMFSCRFYVIVFKFTLKYIEEALENNIFYYLFLLFLINYSMSHYIVIDNFTPFNLHIE